MIARLKHLSLAILLTSALVSVPMLLSAAPASAAQIPCWKQLLNDWYDGTINKIYPLPCYHEAINHLPADVEVYSSAKDDILNALANATKNQKAPPEKTPPATTAGTTSVIVKTTPATATTPAQTITTVTTIVDATPPKKKKGISEVFAKLDPGGPQAFPLPLLILGALAVLLVLAGAGGMLWRRYQDREPGTP